MEGVVDRECHWKGPEGPDRDKWGKGEEGGIVTGLGRKPVGCCYSAEMRRPAIRSTAQEPILWLGTEMEGLINRECHWKGPEGPSREEGGKGGGGSRGHRVVGGGTMD